VLLLSHVAACWPGLVGLALAWVIWLKVCPGAKLPASAGHFLFGQCIISYLYAYLWAFWFGGPAILLPQPFLSAIIMVMGLCVWVSAMESRLEFSGNASKAICMPFAAGDGVRDEQVSGWKKNAMALSMAMFKLASSVDISYE